MTTPNRNSCRARRTSDIGRIVMVAVLLAVPVRGVAQQVDEPSPGINVLGGGPSGAPVSAPLDTGPAQRPRGVADVPLGGTNEPTIAINPLDPSNIAVVIGGGQRRVSTDGGATWSSAQAPTFPAGYGNSGDGVLAFDHQGRLFLTYLGSLPGTPRPLDVFVSEINPNTNAVVAGPFQVTTSGLNSGNRNDKPWLAADRNPASPFAGRLYIVWTEFSTITRIFVSSSANGGASWTTRTPLSPSNGSEGFVWPPHNAVAPNGDLYVAYHATTNQNGGSNGRIILFRSTNGGASYPQRTVPFGNGQADVTFNVQSASGTIPNTIFWLQGSAQPWILPDPTIPGSVYIVANDDPDNNHSSGDAADIFIKRSSDNGLTWSTGKRVDGGPGSSFQVMPTAAIDDCTGGIVVAWYDNRRGFTNGSGNFLLDHMYTASSDRGVTFSSDVRINDVAFDPDLGAPCRFGPGANCGAADTATTLRIGEYNGVAMERGLMRAVWCGNTATGQQTIYDDAQLVITPPPVYVDFATTGFEDGSFSSPFDTLREGVNRVGCTGKVNIFSGSSSETITITKTVTLIGIGSAATIFGGRGAR